jgi:hypothetical protein
MKKTTLNLTITSLLALAAMGISAPAAILAVDSVTLGGSNELLTATVGGTAYSGGVIADAASGYTGPSFDNNLLTGASGTSAMGGTLNLKWNVSGGGFTDNDADPDFFVFEDNLGGAGNDNNILIRAILGDGSLGNAVGPLSVWNVVLTGGVLNGGEFTGRSVAGLAFNFTDLLDASGTNLTNGTTIQGIEIGQSGAADFYEVYANVASPIPEPSTTALLGLGGLALIVRRRR